MSEIDKRLAGVFKRLKRMDRLTLAVGGFVLVVIVASGVLALWQFDKSSDSVNIAVPEDRCAANNTATFSCYKKELTRIINEQEPAYAFAMLRQQYDKSAYVKSQCHQLVHVIGQVALSKYDYDLGKTYSNGDHLCASGFHHGASEQIVKDKGASYIIDNAQAACRVFSQEEQYSLDHYNCVHGIGHGLLEALKGELFEAIKVCTVYTDIWELNSCDSGVFMQNIMIAQSPDESIDGTSKYLKKDDPMYPCNAIEEKHQWGCYIIQSSWALSQVGYDYGKVFAMCDQVRNQGLAATCYQSVGRDASGLQGYDIEKTKTACMQGGSIVAQSNCFIGAAKDFVYNYHDDKQAKNLCNAIDKNLAGACEQAVNSYYASFI